MTRGGMSRRRFLRDAGLATVATSGVLTPPALAARARKPTVAVFGGGIAGLTAAHELIERGFDVTVYERRDWGGKARSTEVPGTGTGGRRDLPGEHGFRVEFGFYQNLPDTLRRIPFGAGSTVFDNLVEAPLVVFARDGGRNDILIPGTSRNPTTYDPQLLYEGLIAVGLESDLPPDAIAYFGRRAMTFMSSCDERRHGQWESVAWTEFIATDRFPEDYTRILANFPRWLQASKANQSSTEFVGQVVETIVYSILGFGLNGPICRVLDAPTDEAWIDPWCSCLRDLGVKLRLGHEVRRFVLSEGRIAGARVVGPRGRRTVRADHYVCAIPHERASPIWTAGQKDVDPALARMAVLRNGTMNGIKFFLTVNEPTLDGIFTCLDSPFAISGLNQAQFWAKDFALTYGDGSVKDCLSVVVADWDEPGPLYGKPASDCSPDELVAETWEQLKRHFNDTGQIKLRDEWIHSYDIDPGMTVANDRLVSGDPLTVPTTGHRQFRPEPATKIPNLFLAGDYLRSDWWVGTMECASETGRRAANAVLDAANSKETPATVFQHYRPLEWEPFKTIDAQRYTAGQPNLFDRELTPQQVRSRLPAPTRT